MGLVSVMAALLMILPSRELSATATLVLMSALLGYIGGHGEAIRLATALGVTTAALRAPWLPRSQELARRA